MVQTGSVCRAAWGCREAQGRDCSPVEGQLVALEEVGTVVGAQGGLVCTIAADCFLHLAVGIQQALLACSCLGPAAPEGSKEAVAPLA